jgi:hypothetical protein
MNKDNIWNILSHYSGNIWSFNSESRIEFDNHLLNNCDFFFRPAFNADDLAKLIYFKDNILIIHEFNDIKFKTFYIPIKIIEYIVHNSENSFEIFFGSNKLEIEIPKQFYSKFRIEFIELFEKLYDILKNK